MSPGSFRARRAIDAQGLPASAIRSAQLRTFQRSGFSFRSDSSSQTIGIAIGAFSRARTPYGAIACWA